MQRNRSRSGGSAVAEPPADEAEAVQTDQMERLGRIQSMIDNCPTAMIQADRDLTIT